MYQFVVRASPHGDENGSGAIVQYETESIIKTQFVHVEKDPLLDV